MAYVQTPDHGFGDGHLGAIRSVVRKVRARTASRTGRPSAVVARRSPPRRTVGIRQAAASQPVGRSLGLRKVLSRGPGGTTMFSKDLRPRRPVLTAPPVARPKVRWMDVKAQPVVRPTVPRPRIGPPPPPDRRAGWRWTGSAWVRDAPPTVAKRPDIIPIPRKVVTDNDIEEARRTIVRIDDPRPVLRPRRPATPPTTVLRPDRAATLPPVFDAAARPAADGEAPEGAGAGWLIPALVAAAAFLL